MVLSRDEIRPDGMVAAKTVEEVFIRESLVWELRLGGQTIRTTAEHPFYRDNEGWVAANELQPGDTLLCEDGSCITVEGIRETSEWQTVYNLRIADYHTYFVGQEAWGFALWAHNAECVNPTGLRETAGIDQNTAKVAIRKLRGPNGEQAAVDYLVSKGVDRGVAKEAVRVGTTPLPVRQSMVPEGADPRQYYVGRTPRIEDGPGQQVLARMEAEGHVVYDVKTREAMIRSTDPTTGEVGWYKLSDSQMGHKVDVVQWWNQEGRFYQRPGGQVAPEVRAWMTDPNNYVIEYKSHNLAKGAMTKNAGHRYLNPSVISLPVLE